MIDPEYFFLALIGLGLIAGILVARSGRGCLSLIVTGVTFLVASATFSVMVQQINYRLLLSSAMDNDPLELVGGYGRDQLVDLSNLAAGFGLGLVALGTLSYLFFMVKDRFGVVAFKKRENLEGLYPEQGGQQTGEDQEPEPAIYR